MNADKRRYNVVNLRSFAFICGSNSHKFGDILSEINTTDVRIFLSLKSNPTFLFAFTGNK